MAATPIDLATGETWIADIVGGGVFDPPDPDWVPPLQPANTNENRKSPVASACFIINISGVQLLGAL